MQKNRPIFLSRALECIDCITEFTQDGKTSFLNDRKTRDAVLRNLEVIGQCLKDFGNTELESAYPHIRWKRIIGFRNILAHEYLGLDFQMVWAVIKDHLPELHEVLVTHLSRSKS